MNEMNSESVRSAAQDYAERIAIPEFDERGIRARAIETRPPQPVWRRAVVAGATAAVVIAAALNGPAVVAQVEGMMRAALTVNGAQVPATIRVANLQEAQKDMPFTVIAPPEIPGYRRSIQEVVAPTSPQSSRILIQYTGSASPVPLTIMESSSMQGSTQMRFWTSKMPGGQPPLNGQPPKPMRPAMNGGMPQQETVLQVRANGRQPFQVRLTPQSWTVGNTRIDLMSPPGTLTTAQIEAIRREMSR